MSEKDEKFGDISQNSFNMLSKNDHGANNSSANKATTKQAVRKKRRAAKSQSPANDLGRLKSQIELLSQEVIKLREEKKDMEKQLKQFLNNDCDIYSDTDIQENLADNVLQSHQIADDNIETNFNKNFPSLEVPRTSNNNHPQHNIPVSQRKIPASTTKKLPPIFVCYNIDSKDMKNKLLYTLNHNKFSFNIINRNVTHISTCTLEDYTTTKNFLKESKINFYTFTPFEMKPYNFLIKKLSDIYDKEEILAYFTALKLNITILTITKLHRSWLIQLSKDSNLEEFKNIQFILHCKVSIVSFKPRGPKQCKNCQRFTHVASNCNMPYRCVKCGDSHGPNNCKLPPKDQNLNEVVLTDPSTGGMIKRIGMPVKCVNCGTEGHTANAGNCPKRIEIMKRIQNKREQSRKSCVRSSSNTALRTNATFASMFPKNNMNVNDAIASQNIFDSLNNDCSRIFGKNFYSCLQKVGEFSQHYVTLDNDEAKSKALFNLLVNLKLKN